MLVFIKVNFPANNSKITEQLCLCTQYLKEYIFTYPTEVGWDNKGIKI